MNCILKKGVCFALVISVILTGCGGKDTDKENVSDKNVAMGRYIEQVIDLPIKDKNENVVGIFRSSENEIELYIQNKETDECYKYVMQSDNSWKMEDEPWLKNANGYNVNNIIEGLDGNLYMQVTKIGEKNIQSLFKSTDKGQTVEQIKMEDWETKDEQFDFYPFTTKIVVAENGNIAGAMYSTINFYNNDGSKYPMEISTVNDGSSIGVMKNSVISLNEDSSSISITEIGSGTQKRIELPSKIYDLAITSDNEGSIYIQDINGIHKLLNGGTTWETLVDGDLTSLSLTTLYNRSIIAGNDEDYYVFAEDDERNRYFMHYVFDENMPSVPSTELTVYSLQDNDTIEQAIIRFQRNNQDVKVNFRVAMSDENSSTVDDNIKALNTELLNNKGADILVLDNMPVDSYIEKGVLADLSDVINPMLESGELLENIIKPYEAEGKYYTVPGRIGMYAFIGNKEAMDSFNTFDELAQLAVKSELPLFGPMNLRGLIKQMFNMQSKELIQEDGSLNEQNLVKFLDNIKLISSKMELKYEKDSRVDETSIFHLGDGECLLNLSEYKGLNDSIINNEMMKHVNGYMKTANDVFIPHLLVGVNNASEKQDLAKEFIKTLLSEPVQSVDIYNGFPVNSNSLDKWNDLEKEIGMTSTFSDGSMFTANWIGAEDRKIYNKLCRSLTTAAKVDNVLLEMITSEVNAFIKGKKTSEETAKNITDKTKNYLSE